MIHSGPIKILVLAALIFQSLLLACDSKTKELANEDNHLWAGASSATINPDIGMFIAGDKPNRRFTEIHDSLFVKAVVLRKDKEIIALVTLDCIGLLYPDTQKIREKACEMINDSLIKP